MSCVLIIEDDLAHANLMEIALRTLNYEIYIASDALEGIELARHIDPKLIYMDLSLPVMNGLEAIAIIREDPDLYAIPIFLVTASRRLEIIRRAEELGADACISKPFNVKHLREESLRVLG